MVGLKSKIQNPIRAGTEQGQDVALDATKASLVYRQSPTEYLFLGVRMRILLSSKDTGGQFSLIESVMPPGGDGGLHLHANEDESMHLLEGELEVTIGDRTLSLAAGESYFAPRNVPHRIRNLNSTPARSILVTTPGGFDEFISQAGFRLTDGITPRIELPAPEQMAKLLKLGDKFGIKVMAPAAGRVAAAAESRCSTPRLELRRR